MLSPVQSSNAGAQRLALCAAGSAGVKGPLRMVIKKENSKRKECTGERRILWACQKAAEDKQCNLTPRDQGPTG